MTPGMWPTIMEFSNAQIRGTHPYAFRSGEWAELVAIVWFNNRLCYEVAFPNVGSGSHPLATVDVWSVINSGYDYEVRPKEYI